MLHFKASKLAVLAAAFGAMFTDALPASATLYDVTLSGTVIHGLDGAGTIEPLISIDGVLYDAPLDGASYSASFVFDTGKGQSLLGSTSNDVQGGSEIGCETPVVSAVITIAGQSISIPGNDYGAFYEVYDGTYTELAYDSGYSYNDGLNFKSDSTENVIVHTGLLLINFFGSFSYELDPGDYQNVNFTIDEESPYGVNRTAYAFGDVQLSTVTVIADAPEPSTWSMMLIGFASLGYAGHLRGKKVHSSPPPRPPALASNGCQLGQKLGQSEYRHHFHKKIQ